MQRNAALRTIIQDFKSEYPDISEHIIANVVETYNGSIPSIRTVLNRQRSVNLQCGVNGNMTRMHHRSGDAAPCNRPVSIPNFDQLALPLSVDVNNDHLPNTYQMETYIEHGLRPLPNRPNSASPRMETDYVNQQRHCLSLLEVEVRDLDEYLRGLRSDVRCREQLHSQREFGSDQRFPSKTDVERLQQVLARIRWEAEYMDRRRNNQYIPNIDPGAYQQSYRTKPAGNCSVSAPGTPDVPYPNRTPRHHHVYNSPNYTPTGYPGYFHPSHQQLIPQHPQIPPQHLNRSYSARPPPSNSPRPCQQPVVSPGIATVNNPTFHRGHSRTPSDGSRPSRPSSHRNSQASTGEVAGGPADEEESEENWSCWKCTFSNHPIMRVCEMCETPRARPADL